MFELYTSRMFQWSALGLLLLFVGVEGAFSFLQGGVSIPVSLLYSLIGGLFLLMFVLLLWIPMQFTSRIIILVLYTVVALVIWSLVSFVAAYLLGGNDTREFTYFIRALPVRIVIALLFFIIGTQYFRMKILREQLLQEPAEEVQAADEQIDHIAVKSNNKLQIVAVDELVYIQADGDYVTLVTAEGRYLKDQTMKYFEGALPVDRFVRIHRSYIVNLTQVSRIERTGKESYSAILKNGFTIRASTNGYKLLKQRLSL